jgi:hypothetical protein
MVGNAANILTQMEPFIFPKAMALGPIMFLILFLMERLMTDKPRNVLFKIGLPTQSSLRAAIANILRDVQRDFEECDQKTCERIHVSVGTIANARNCKTDLNATTIARIGFVYGASYVDPYHRLYGATATITEYADKVDPLASLAESVSILCKMRDPKGDGGTNETPKELLDALPKLKAAARDLTSYISSIEKLRIAA